MKRVGWVRLILTSPECRDLREPLEVGDMVSAGLSVPSRFESGGTGRIKQRYPLWFMLYLVHPEGVPAGRIGFGVCLLQGLEAEGWSLLKRRKRLLSPG